MDDEMKNKAEEKVSKFYNTVGWSASNGLTEDAALWEDFREAAREYVSKCRLRVLDHIPARGDKILDMASGPIQYPEYLEYSKNFNKRYCCDLSKDALAGAKAKIGDHGDYLEGSFFDMDLQENYFDCALSLHTIYHMDKDLQEKAVRKLLYVTKPGQPVIVVYSNPNTLIKTLAQPYLIIKKLFSSKQDKFNRDNPDLYFYQHPNEWWQRFSDVADLKIYPWRSFAVNITRVFFPNNVIGKKMFDVFFALENKFPNFFAKRFEYIMVVMTKR